MAEQAARADLAALARPSGALAMLALDQRESLRAMLRSATGAEPTDGDVVAFKVAAAHALTPHASAVLLDVESGLGPVRAAGAIAAGCGLIVAADQLTQAVGGPVESTETDEAVLADDAIAGIADAYKLLVIWRPGRDVEARRRTVRSFLEGCRRRGRPGIVESIVRPANGAPLGPREHAARVLEAARELGALGPDVYKAEVPTLGAAGDSEITEASRRLTEALACPWVVLSNGTPADRFAHAAIAACRGGASGFLAGRAIWQASISAPDVAVDLETAAATRLRDLAARIDGEARPWTEARRP
jgi:sulfofructosephosphate aldolase